MKRNEFVAQAIISAIPEIIERAVNEHNKQHDPGPIEVYIRDETRYFAKRINMIATELDEFGLAPW